MANRGVGQNPTCQNACMELKGVHHVALCVDDVETAISFYASALGCQERADRPDFGFPGAWLDAGTQQIHLMQFGAPERSMSHFALQIDDAQAWSKHLTANGVEHQLSPHTPGAGRQIFLHDPAGNQIELNEPDQ